MICGFCKLYIGPHEESVKLGAIPAHSECFEKAWLEAGGIPQKPHETTEAFEQRTKPQ